MASLKLSTISRQRSAGIVGGLRIASATKSQGITKLAMA
jgi:hypothetical protein